MTTYNKSEIMTAAWNMYRKSKANGNKFVKFGSCLECAWLNAKNAAADTRTPLEKATARLHSLEMKDRWSAEDYELSRSLRNEIAALQDSKMAIVA